MYRNSVHPHLKVHTILSSQGPRSYYLIKKGPKNKGRLECFLSCPLHCLERETPNQSCEDPKTPPLRDSSRLRVSPLVVLGVFGGFSVCGWVCTEGLMFACGLTHPPHAQPSLMVHPLSMSSASFSKSGCRLHLAASPATPRRGPSPHSPTTL